MLSQWFLNLLSKPSQHKNGLPWLGFSRTFKNHWLLVRLIGIYFCLYDKLNTTMIIFKRWLKWCMNLTSVWIGLKSFPYYKEYEIWHTQIFISTPPENHLFFSLVFHQNSFISKISQPPRILMVAPLWHVDCICVGSGGQAGGSSPQLLQIWAKFCQFFFFWHYEFLKWRV